MALFAVAPASAQEQVGAIQGTVSDASGAVLPGATVEAVSAGGTRLSGTTNESGAYRFPRVPPGTYVVIAKLNSFNPAELQNVKVGLGDTATANVTLEVGAVSETISVVGEAGQIDVKSLATSAAITGEDIAVLPKEQDFATIATMAPGVTQEGFAGGLSIDGASGSDAENSIVSALRRSKVHHTPSASRSIFGANLGSGISRSVFAMEAGTLPLIAGCL